MSGCLGGFACTVMFFFNLRGVALLDLGEHVEPERLSERLCESL